MNGRIGLAVLCASLCAAGLADAKVSKAPKGSPLDGSWTAHGTVVVARHIQGDRVGDQFTRTWTFKSKCAKTCHTSLSYATSGGRTITVPLKGSGKTYSGTLENQVFGCTDQNGKANGTATGSLAFKVKVTSFTKHKKRKVAGGLTGRGIQSGTGCATVKEIVDFKLTRRSF